MNTWAGLPDFEVSIPGQGPAGPGPEGPHRRRGPPRARGPDPPHAAPGGQRTKLSVDRQKTPQSFSGALSPTSRTVTPHPTEGNQNTWQTTPAPGLPQHETGTGKTTIVPDNTPHQSPDRPPPARPAPRAHHPCSPAAVHTRPQPGRARPEHGQEQHREHSARGPRRNPRRVRLIHRRPNIRPRLRAPSRPAKPETILFHDGHRFGFSPVDLLVFHSWPS